MNNKTILWIVVAILVLGAGYWFMTDYQKEGSGAMQQQEQSMGKIAAGSEPKNEDPMMMGTWRSEEDAKFTREFTSDSRVTDRYEGEASATMSGSVTVVDPTKEVIGIASESLTGMTVLRVTWDNGDVMFFGVKSLSEDDLELINLSGRGNVLVFTKVN